MTSHAAHGTRGRPWPVLSWAPGYQRRWLRFDLIAGLTVCAILVPEGDGLRAARRRAPRVRVLRGPDRAARLRAVGQLAAAGGGGLIGRGHHVGGDHLRSRAGSQFRVHSRDRGPGDPGRPAVDRGRRLQARARRPVLLGVRADRLCQPRSSCSWDPSQCRPPSTSRRRSSRSSVRFPRAPRCPAWGWMPCRNSCIRVARAGACAELGGCFEWFCGAALRPYHGPAVVAFTGR
jgi:hypothetical protein